MSGPTGRTVLPDFGLSGYERRTAEETAEHICASCTVVHHCRSHALTVNEPHGVWGGMSARERATIVLTSMPRVSPSEF